MSRTVLAALVLVACSRTLPVARDAESGVTWTAPSPAWRVLAAAEEREAPERARIVWARDGVKAALVVQPGDDAGEAHAEAVFSMINTDETFAPGRLGALAARDSQGVSFIGSLTGRARVVTAAAHGRVYTVLVWGATDPMRAAEREVERLLRGLAVNPT